jgi:hypothetical protein
MKIDTSKFHGIFPAFYACYDDYGNICKKKVKNLARWGFGFLYMRPVSRHFIFYTPPFLFQLLF